MPGIGKFAFGVSSVDQAQQLRLVPLASYTTPRDSTLVDALVRLGQKPLGPIELVIRATPVPKRLVLHPPARESLNKVDAQPVPTPRWGGMPR